MIQTTQTCDVCRDKRVIESDRHGLQDGWAEIKRNVHMCPRCIDRTLRERVNP